MSSPENPKPSGAGKLRLFSTELRAVRPHGKMPEETALPFDNAAGSDRWSDTMRTATVAELRHNLPAVEKAARKGAVTILRRGRAVATLNATPADQKN
jgi:hypothetical protein